mgnify:CR=1 FL=1
MTTLLGFFIAIILRFVVSSEDDQGIILQDKSKKKIFPRLGIPSKPERKKGFFVQPPPGDGHRRAGGNGGNHRHDDKNDIHRDTARLDAENQGQHQHNQQGEANNTRLSPHHSFPLSVPFLGDQPLLPE